MPSKLLISIVAFAAVAYGIYWLITTYSKPSPPKTDLSAIINKEWSTYHGGGAEEIASIEDDLDLSSAVFEWCLPDESTYSVALEQVANSNAGKRAVYLVNTLDYEVGNGGFNQYFYNKGTILAPETIKSLRHIGQPERAAILEKALESYSQVKQRHDAAQAAGSSEAQLKAFSETYKDNPLDNLDTAYYDAGPRMWKVLAAYIRAHPDEFRN
jgi:hypothetical protein